MSIPINNLSLPERMGFNAQQFAQLLKQYGCKLRVAMPGIVQSFNATKQTVVVQPAVQEKVNKNVNGSLVASDMPLPQLLDVPVVILGGGGGSGTVITFPIQTGDECLVIFNDFCIDSWWSSGGSNNVQLEKRRHDLSDAIAIIGPRSTPKFLSDYNTSAAELRTTDGTVKLTISESGIVITGDVTINGTLGVNELAVFNGEVDFESSITGDSFLNHTHGGVSTGGGSTGGVDSE